MAMWIRTKTNPAFYIHEIRGVIYISWVSEKDKTRALPFPLTDADRWRDILSEMTELNLEIVKAG